MPSREMTLGEEIISLARKGVDTPTVERMYRKYIDLRVNKKAAQECTEYSKTDILSNIKVGDQIEIPLGELGTFKATAHDVTNDKILFIFDDCVTKRQINENGSNEGGYENSDLKEWIDNELFNMFPEVLKKRMIALSIPSIGEFFGWNEEWTRTYFKYDGDEQLPLMKYARNRGAYLNNDSSLSWLRNALSEETYSCYFANVSYSSCIAYCEASNYLGVRPEFWLLK